MTTNPAPDAQAGTVAAVLAAHFIMWRGLDGGGPAGEWFCHCGLKFGFSDSAIKHVAAALAAAGLTTEADQMEWPCDDYKPPLTCYTTPKPKTLICGGCRERFPDGPEVAAIYARRATEADQPRDGLRAAVEALEAEVAHWKAHAEEAGEGFAQVCRDAARLSARNVELLRERDRLYALLTDQPPTPDEGGTR
jgi:hypothetical protein